MNKDQLITWVKSVIYPNDNNEIDAQKHQDLEIGVINSLMDAVASMTNGYLGTIRSDAPAPTPAKNGYYIFSTAGAVSYISGVPTVKVGDWLSVTYVGLNYTYTNVNKLLNLSDDYTISDSNVGASLKALYDGLSKLKNDLRGNSSLTIANLEAMITTADGRIDSINRNIFDVGRGRLSGGTYSKQDARLLVLQSGRSRNYQLAYTLLDDTSVTENYKGASFSDGEWVKDSNWQTLTTKDYVDGQLVGVYDDVSDFNASLGTFPTSGSGSTGYVMRADCYPVTVAGTVGGLTMKVGDILKAKVDNPAQIASNWVVMRNGVAYTPEDLANKNVSNGYAGLDAAKNIANDVIRTDFRMSQGYILDGVDDYLTIPHNDKLNFGTDDFSIQCCLTVSPSDNTERIYYKITATSGIEILKEQSNVISVVMLQSNGTRTGLSSNKVILKEERLNCFIIVSQGNAQLYINGVLDNVMSLNLISPVDNTSSAYLGVASINYVNPLKGRIYLVRLFNRALSQQDVTYYENSGRPDLQRLKYEDTIDNYGEQLKNTAFTTTNDWLAFLPGTLTVSNNVLTTDCVGTSYQGGAITTLKNVAKLGKKFRIKFNVNSNIANSLITGFGVGSGELYSSFYYSVNIGDNTIVKEQLIKAIDNNNFYLYPPYNTAAILKYSNPSVVQVGCVLELLPQNALPDRWLDSQNGLDAIASGSPAIATETPITDTQIVDNITNNIAVGTANRDYTLPTGYLVDSVCVKSTVSLTALQLVNVSTSETLLTGKTVSSTAGKHLPITADQSSPTTDTTIRLNATGNTGLGFNIVINIKKCL